MFVPKSKYTVKSTPGGEFETKEGSEYVGSVITLYTGKSYAGSNPSKLGEEVFPIETLKKSQDPTDFTLRQEFPEPTERDYNKGSYIRYFLVDKRDRKIYEVTKTTYTRFSEVKFVARIQIPWTLQSPVEDTKRGDYIYPGARKKNQPLIDNLTVNFPEFKDFLSAEQFVR